MLRKFRFFTIQLLKETFFLLFIFLDIVGLILLYWKDIEIPIWLFALLPIIGIYAGSFNIYRRNSADIRVQFFEIEDTQFKVSGTHSDIPQSFIASINGNIVNYGYKTGVLEEFSVGLLSINDIKDSFHLKKLNIGFSTSPLLPKKEFIKWSPRGYSYERINLPLVLEKNKIIPCCVALEIDLLSTNLDELAKMLKWFKSIKIQIQYSTTQNDGRTNEINSFNISNKSFEYLIETIESTNQKTKKN